MFKIAKLKKVNNEKVGINVITLEKNQYKNGKKQDKNMKKVVKKY